MPVGAKRGHIDRLRVISLDMILISVFMRLTKSNSNDVLRLALDFLKPGSKFGNFTREFSPTGARDCFTIGKGPLSTR